MRPAIAYISLQNLAHNYHLLCERTRHAEVMAVVKANAYGHGLEHIAPHLYSLGCRSFAVTDADEGVCLRHLVGEDANITLLSGIFDAADVGLSIQHDLTPVVTELWHVECLQQQDFHGAVWLKVNTGMNRLGSQSWKTIWQACEDASFKFKGVMSHLASTVRV